MDKAQTASSASSDILNRLRSEIDDIVALIGRPITVAQPCAMVLAPTSPTTGPAVTALPFESSRSRPEAEFDPGI